jgi:hypothetical protein
MIELVSESGQLMKVNKADFQANPKKFTDKGFKPKGAAKKSTPIPETTKPTASPAATGAVPETPKDWKGRGPGPGEGPKG